MSLEQDIQRLLHEVKEDPCTQNLLALGKLYGRAGRQLPHAILRLLTMQEVRVLPPEAFPKTPRIFTSLGSKLMPRVEVLSLRHIALEVDLLLSHGWEAVETWGVDTGFRYISISKRSVFENSLLYHVGDADCYSTLFYHWLMRVRTGRPHPLQILDSISSVGSP